MAVCWQDSMVLMLRAIIQDLGATPQYSDEVLQQLIVTSAKIVSNNVDFDSDYSINVVVPNITPDPSNDDAFTSLVVLKAACFLAMGEQRAKAQRALMIKDGPSNIDSRPSADATAKWAESVCDDYDKAEIAIKFGNLSLGKAIVGPYRYDNSNMGPGISERSKGYNPTNFT